MLKLFRSSEQEAAPGNNLVAVINHFNSVKASKQEREFIEVHKKPDSIT